MTNHYEYRPILTLKQIAKYARYYKWCYAIFVPLMILTFAVLMWEYAPNPDGEMSLVQKIAFAAAIVFFGIFLTFTQLFPDPQPLLEKQKEQLALWRAEFREVNWRARTILEQRDYLVQYEFKEIQQRVEVLTAPVSVEIPNEPPSKEQRLGNLKVLDAFPHTPTLRVILTYMLTFGIYAFVWGFSRAKMLNQHSPGAGSLRWRVSGLLLMSTALLIGFIFARLVQTGTVISFESVTVLMLAMAVALFSGFGSIHRWFSIFRERFLATLGVVDRDDPRWISAGLSSCFGLFYLNYKINQIRNFEVRNSSASLMS